MEEIVNRVTSSPLIMIDLEEIYPKEERVVYDLKDNLFQGLILKEKDFREYLKDHNWAQYRNKYVAINCSADAIVPTWAYMLLAIHLEPYVAGMAFGDLNTLEKWICQKFLNELDTSAYLDKKIVIKGCAHLPLSEFAFVELTRLLLPVVSSLMFGEPCSTVPLYKKTKTVQDQS